MRPIDGTLVCTNTTDPRNDKTYFKTESNKIVTVDGGKCVTEVSSYYELKPCEPDNHGEWIGDKISVKGSMIKAAIKTQLTKDVVGTEFRRVSPVRGEFNIT